MAYDEAPPGSDLQDCMQAAGWLGGEGRGAAPSGVVLTVLAVDMDAGIAAALGAAGMAVTQAGDGLQALDLLQAGAAPDVVLSDITMPGLDGLDLIRAIHRMDHLRATQIVLLTAETAPALKARARAAGAAGWIARPCDPSKLVRSIHIVTC